MPARFFDGAPDIIRESVLDILHLPGEHLPYDVVFRDTYGRDHPRGPFLYGLDFGDGYRGCTFELDAFEMQRFRSRNRRRRVGWSALPADVRTSILAWIKMTTREAARQ